MSKLDQLRALRETKFGGGVEKHGDFSQTRRVTTGAPVQIAGVAPGPPKPKRGRPRIGEKRETPWIEAGMSKTTWYRRQKESK